MNDNKKTKAELIKELDSLRHIVSDMESEHQKTDEQVFQSVHNWEETFCSVVP